MPRKIVLGWKFLKLINDLPMMQGLKPPFFLYLLSQHVIHGVLSAAIAPWPPSKETKELVWEWISSHIHHGHRKTGFLRSPPVDDESWALHFARVMELAEVLYNLQAVQNIETIYRRFINNPAELESTMLELEGLKLLMLADLRFQLNVPGPLKLNYECDILCSEVLTAHCEMKCKLEGATISEGAITGPLEKARNQLPKGGCGVVLLKIPTSWGSSDEEVSIILKFIDKALRGTERIAEVIIYRRDLILTESRTLYPFSLVEILNSRSPFYAQLGGGILSSADLLTSRWVKFSDFSTSQRMKEVLRSQFPYSPP